MSEYLLLCLVLLDIPFRKFVVGQFSPIARFDGSIGVLPLSFCEQDDSNFELFTGQSVDEFLSKCEDVTCEDCAIVFRNSAELYVKENKERGCDSISEYFFSKLKIAKMMVKKKKDDNNSFGLIVVYFAVNAIVISAGIIFIGLGHMNIWLICHSILHDPTTGPRLDLHIRKVFKFEHSHEGTVADEEGSMIKYNTTGLGGQEKNAIMWPWENKTYDFSKIEYRQRDNEAADHGTNLSSKF